jgi:autotransporter-associated beta strand protein
MAPYFPTSHFAALVAFSVTFSLASPLHGNTNWILSPSQSGNWSAVSNWDNGVPTSSSNAYIVNGGTATVNLSGEVCNYLYLGGTGAGTVQMTTGGLMASYSEYVGNQGSGALVQSGGTNTVSYGLFLGYNATASGYYDLSGTGTVISFTYGEYIGYSGTGCFVQSGGTNSMLGNLNIGCNAAGSGTYELRGAGSLSCSCEFVGSQGTGTFTQTGGINSAAYVEVGSSSKYTLSAGTLSLSGGLVNRGILDLSNSLATINASSSIVDLSTAVLSNSAGVSLTLDSHSILIVPIGFDPTTYFAHYSNAGLLHQAGSTLAISATDSIYGISTLSDHVDCQGTLSAQSGYSYNSYGINLYGGVNVHGSGTVNLGNGSLYVNDMVSGMSSGSLKASSQYIGSGGTGTFVQSGGTNTVSGNFFYVGSDSTSNGTYQLSGTAYLSSSFEDIGDQGVGAFWQSGGTHTVANEITLGCGPGGSGTYELSGTGYLSPLGLTVGDSGAGTFSHTAGTNSANSLLLGNGSTGVGTYNLSGSGQLLVGMEYVGLSGTGTFMQSGGTNTVRALIKIGSNGTYSLGAGVLNVTGGLANNGVLDLSNSSGAINATSAIIDLSVAPILDSTHISVTLDAHSLLIVPAGFDPAASFPGYSNAGLVHHVGSTLTIPSGYSIQGSGNIVGHVACQGTLTTGAAIGISGGLDVSGSGSVNLGYGGSIYVNDTTSGITGGSLTSQNQRIGSGGTGTFAQSGGTNTVYGLLLGDNLADDGIYLLSGTGLLTASERVGGSGTGVFQHSGGTNTASELYVGSGSTSNGVYELGGTGYLSVSDVEMVGDAGSGTFRQSGGTNTLAGAEDGLYVGYVSPGNGVFALSGTGCLIAPHETIGWTGSGTFSQSGGTNTVSSLNLGILTTGSGTYCLTGGTLILGSLSQGSGAATFSFGGGTLQASGQMACLLPLTLTGIGGNANVNTAGYAVALSGQLSGPGGLNKLGTNTLTLSAANTYSGSTTVSAGTLSLAGAGSLVLDVNDDTNSVISVASGAKLDIYGMIKLDVGDVTASSESWTLVSNSGTTVYEPSFTLAMLGGAPFMQGNDVWTYAVGSQEWAFSEATGVLSLTTVPEPSTAALLAVGLFSLLSFTWQRWKHKRRDKTVPSDAGLGISFVSQDS